MIFKGKNAFVTGATGGLGSEICIALANNGCNVFVIGRNKDKLFELQNILGKKCLGSAVCNLENEHDLQEIATSCLAIREIDILINCAGVFPVSSLEETSLNTFDECFNVNVRAPFILSKIFTKKMKENQWGRIVNICSSSSYSGFRGTSVYCASKHALLGLSRALYDELKGDGVRVFSISPGSIQTPMGREVRNQDYDTFMDPKEISEFITKLISYDCNMVSEEVRLNRITIQ